MTIYSNLRISVDQRQAMYLMSALFGFICTHLECARMKDARRARYGVYTGSVGYVNKFCSVWSFQCETLRLLYAYDFN